MDAARFDRLARALAARRSRRAAAGFLAGALAGLLAPAADETAALDRCGTPAVGRRRKCKKEGTRTVCFEGRCYPMPVAGNRCYATGPACRNGAVCAASEPGIERCTCAGGLTACGIGPDRACVDTRSSRQHCGSCFSLCPVGAGECCAVGPLAPGECVDTRTDERHCGGCGRACPSGQPCLDGRCLNQCRGGQTPCGGTCVDLQTDPSNCGACGNACQGLRPCNNGACGQPPSQCVGGLTLCGGQCVDLLRDRDNCGACGNACRVGATCAGGACTEPTRCKDDGEICAANAECCRAPESVCAGGVCGRRCSAYGGPCATQADCCETGPGERPCCNDGVCDPLSQAC